MESDNKNSLREDKIGEDTFREDGFGKIKNNSDLSLAQKLKRKITIWYNYGTTEYFIRVNTYARLLQNKYLIKDYFVKKKYKVTDYRQEFQQELTFVLPFAFWHYNNGTLAKTISCKYTKEFYFFSEDHEEKYDTRVSKLPKNNYEIPNMYHCKTFDTSKWTQVPLKAHYKNHFFIFERPLLIIANKFNTEWNREPINYLSKSILEKVILKYRYKYQIVYNRPGSELIVMDNSEILEMNEANFIRENYPDVILAEDLYVKFKDQVNNYNHFQLMLYANCEHFLSVHGGTAALASYFGGRNIILSKRGYEHKLNEFNTIFTALSGAEIYHAKEDAEVLAYLEKHF